MKSVYILLFCAFTTAFSVQQNGSTEEARPNYIISLADWQILCGVAQEKISFEAAGQAVTNLLKACNNTVQFMEISFIPHRLHDFEKWDWQACESLRHFVHICTSSYLVHYHTQEIKKLNQTIEVVQNKLSLTSDINEFLSDKLDGMLLKKEK